MISPSQHGASAAVYKPLRFGNQGAAPPSYRAHMTSPSHLLATRRDSARARATVGRAGFSLGLIAALLLSACASTAPVSDPGQAGVALPAAWAQASNAANAAPADLSHWWQRFNDAQMLNVQSRLDANRTCSKDFTNRLSVNVQGQGAAPVGPRRP